MHRNALFDVRLEGTRHVIKARGGGKLQRYLIKIVVGDVVKVEIPSCDFSGGRIVYRLPAGRIP
jgi:translation initiation factor IF-1